MDMLLKALGIVLDIVFVIFIFYIVFVLGLRFLWRWRSKKMVGQEIPYPDTTFNRLRRGKGFIYFSSPKCKPCKLVDPIVKKLSKELKGIHVIKIDVTKEPEKARAFGILATPSIIITENGKIKEVLMGPVSEGELRGKLS